MKRSPRQRQNRATRRGRQINERIRATLTRLVPRHAIVLIVSKGDPALMRSSRYVAWHFPRDRQGRYAGYHPGGSTSAVAHLEGLRAEGAAYLAFPSTALWWLDHYSSFREHIEEHYRLVSVDTDRCRVYSLLDAPPATDRSAGSHLRRVIADFQHRFAHDPSMLDWDSGLELAKCFPELSVFSPPAPGAALPYLPRSVDLVVTGRPTAAEARDAQRVARSAVVQLDERRSVSEIRWRPGPRIRRPPSVSLIIPCHNQSHLTQACLGSLFETLPATSNAEVVVVDDGSTDGTPRLLSQWKRREPRLRVVRRRSNGGFGAACNQGARKARGSLLVFLNNDLVFLPGWLEPLLDVLRKHPKAGAVGGKLILPDGRLQEAGGVVFCDGSALNFARGQSDLDAPLVSFLREADYCSGALLATRKTLFDQLGGFEPQYRPAYYEDVDYCFRLRESGYRVYFQPASAVVHREGGTSGTDLKGGVKRFQSLNHKRFVDRWGHRLHHQPVRPMRVDQTALHALAFHAPSPTARRKSLPGRRALVCASSPPEPDRDSGSRRLRDLMGLLQAEGYTVTFFALQQLNNPRYVRPLQQDGIAVFSSTQVKLQTLLTAAHFEFAALTSWSVAEACIPVIRRVSRHTRVLVDSVDLHFLRQARQHFGGLRNSEAPAPLDARFGNDLARELNVYAASDAVLTVSAREAHLLGDLIPKADLIHVWPDLEPLTHAPAPMSSRRGVLFTGSFRHAPNLDALEFLCHHVLPRLSPELAELHPLTIIGDPANADLRDLTTNTPHVRLIGWVPDVQPYLNRARLSVVPLRYGAGTKRKLLQSLAAGTPAVSTTIGVEGFAVKNGEHVLIADDPDAFARDMERLLTDAHLWRRFSRNGRELAATTHSKRSVRHSLRSILRQVRHRPTQRGRSIDTASQPESTRLDLQSYQDLQDRIRQHARVALPPHSRVLVVSRGDDELLKLGNVKASHFPQTAGGVFAGYHPGDSEAAIAHLTALQAQNAEYILFPQTSFWWLDHYREFTDHLRRRHVQVLNNEACVLFRLSGPPSPLRAGAEPRRDLSTSSARPASNGSYDIVCLPIIDWAFRFQRPQQLMVRFAAAGHRVFYLSQTFRSADPPCRVKRLLPGVFEVSLRGPKLNIYQDALNEDLTRSLFCSLEALHTTQSIRQAILMVQLPFWWPLAEAARRAFGWPIVYDCMDDHAGFDTNHPRMLDAEATLLTQADLVVASSALLETRARQHNSKVLLVRNGCDYEHFATVRHRTRAARPVIGYYGAIAHWFDSDLVADLAERRPDWRFLLVGSTHTADLGRLTHLPNVSLPGEQPYDTIPTWLARFDVAILPFKRNRLTESTNPVKAYEILAGGKPLVAVPLPEMLSIGSIVQTASGPEEFERQIERALQRRGSRDVSSRRAYARQHTWQARWNALVSRCHADLPLAKPRRTS